MSDYSDSISEEYLSEHESDREFVENDDYPTDDNDYVPEGSETSEDFTSDNLEEEDN
jgi:hypothetical protein